MRSLTGRQQLIIATFIAIVCSTLSVLYVWSQSVPQSESQIFLPVILQSPGAAQEREPNNTSDKANRVVVSGSTYVGLHNDQDDFYTFNADSPGPIKIDLTSNHKSAVANLHIHVALFYESVQEAKQKGVDTQPPYTILHVGEAGRYFVRIYTDPCCFDSTKSYQLSISFPQATPTSTPTPTNTPDLSLSYTVTDFYVPAGWMLNSENPAKVAFDPSYAENCYTNSTCYKISWQPDLVEWVGMYWIHPNADAGGRWSGSGQPGCNLSGATRVTFWARGEKGGELIGVEAALNNGNKVGASPIYLTTSWVQYTLEVSAVDLTNVVGAFAWLIFRAENMGQTVFYLDDIRYRGIEPSHIICTTATPTPISLIQKIAIPSYFYPGGIYWPQLEGGAPTVGLAIINPNSGVGTEIDQNYVNQTASTKAKNITVIGYVYTSYGQRSATTVKTEIDKYYEWYSIDGIFFDEASNDCADLAYYQDLYDYIKAKSGVAKVVLNPGINTGECYTSASDIIITFEDTYANYVNWQPSAWEANYAPDRFWHLVINTSESNMPNAIALAKSRRAGWLYVTSDTLPNPWDTLPPAVYWSDELDLASH